jgi:hypothetical protein
MSEWNDIPNQVRNRAADLIRNKVRQVPKMREEINRVLGNLIGDRDAALIVALVEELQRLREELEAYNPIRTLQRGETASQCSICEQARAIPNLPGCAMCVRTIINAAQRRGLVP